MKTVKRTLVVGRRVTINTEENDPVDIRCGGPMWLGYDFIVDADENVKDLKKFIDNTFKKFNKYYSSVYVSSGTEEVPKSSIWSHSKIEKCIKES